MVMHIRYDWAICTHNEQGARVLRRSDPDRPAEPYDLFVADLSDLDRRLLAALREDGRAPVAGLARQLGVTRATVTSHLDRLVADDVIVGFTVRVRDESAAGGVRAVSLIEVEGRSTDDVIRRLRGFPEIGSMHSTNGAWDLVAEHTTADLVTFDRLLNRIRSVPGIINSQTSLLLTSVLR
jgi:DNA-binding Lrp family transcriptional regulator